MTEQTAISLATLRPFLEAKGWDVSVEDTLEAFLGDASGQYRLAVSQSGRMLLQWNTMTRKPYGEIIQSGPYKLTVALQSLAMITVSAHLPDLEAFDELLEAMLSAAHAIYQKQEG